MRRFAFAFLLLLVPACATATADNAAVQRDFTEHRSTVQVTAEGVVTAVLEDATGPSGHHQRFIIRLAGATQTVLIENNVDVGQRVPVAANDDLTIHGEYIWNDQGGLIHYTHHDPAPGHEGGWIDRNGVRYQ